MTQRKGNSYLNDTDKKGNNKIYFMYKTLEYRLNSRIKLYCTYRDVVILTQMSQGGVFHSFIDINKRM